VGGREIQLSPTEYGILFSLIVHAGSIITLDQLRREIGGSKGRIEALQLRISVAQLRRKSRRMLRTPLRVERAGRGVSAGRDMIRLISGETTCLEGGTLP